jgi:hypothetical protein
VVKFSDITRLLQGLVSGVRGPIPEPLTRESTESQIAKSTRKLQEASTTRRPALHQRHGGATGSDAGGFLPQVPVARLTDGGGPKVGGATPRSCLMRSFTFTGDRISLSRPVVRAGTRLIRATGCTAGVLPFWLSLHLILGPWPKSCRLRLSILRWGSFH